MRNNEQGRSMIEMLGVLAIVGVLSVGGIAGYSKAMNKFKTNKVIDQINMIATNVRTLFSSQRNYNGLNNSVAIRSGLIPGEMYDQTQSTSTITNAFGGAVYVKAYTITSADDAYEIWFEGIPANSCSAFVTTDWGGDIGSGLQFFGAGSTLTEAGLKTVSNASNAVVGKPGNSTVGIPFSVTNMGLACPRSGTIKLGWIYQ